jgi:hypothetical protein
MGALRVASGYDGHDMRSVRRRPALSLLAALAIVVTACGTSPASPTAPGGTASPVTSQTPTETPVTPTEVPGGASGPAEPTPVGRTETEWGTILDAVPDSFPVYPGARPAGPVDAPVSTAYVADAAVGAIATWYQGALAALGFDTSGLSQPLEDGSRVLDVLGDLPECRLQLTFRPAGGSTMITVLYAAGCAGGEG